MDIKKWKQMLTLEKKLDESLLKEDILTDLRKTSIISFDKFTPAAVVWSFVSALQDAYDEGKVNKTYVNKTIAALQSAQKRLGKL